MSNDFEKNLETLTLLSEALTMQRTLEEGLDHITSMTCSLMETEQAVFLFRDEERKELIVKSVVGIDSPNLKIGHRLYVPQRLHSILWLCRYIHQIGRVDAGIDGITFPIIINPITVKGSRVGLLIAGGPKDKDTDSPYDAVRRKLFNLISPFASLVIENSKVYDYLRQSVVLNSKELRQSVIADAGDKRNEEEQLMINSLKNPIKVVNKLAETFFMQLAETGFTAGHITSAAAHILDCITKSEIDPTSGKLTFTPSND